MAAVSVLALRHGTLSLPVHLGLSPVPGPLRAGPQQPAGYGTNP
jgi:hypothetical protein